MQDVAAEAKLAWHASNGRFIMLISFFVKHAYAGVLRDDIKKALGISSDTLQKAIALSKQKGLAMLPDKVQITRDGYCEDGVTRISIALEKLETDYAQKWAKMSPEQYHYRDGTTVEVEVIYELQQTPTFICTQYTLDMLGTLAKVGHSRCMKFFAANKHVYRRAVEQKCMCDRCYQADCHYTNLVGMLYSADKRNAKEARQARYKAAVRCSISKCPPPPTLKRGTVAWKHETPVLVLDWNGLLAAKVRSSAGSLIEIVLRSDTSVLVGSLAESYNLVL